MLLYCISLTHDIILAVVCSWQCLLASLYSCSDDVGRAAADSFRLQVRRLTTKIEEVDHGVACSSADQLLSSSALMDFYVDNGNLPVRLIGSFSHLFFVFLDYPKLFMYHTMFINYESNEI